MESIRNAIDVKSERRYQRNKRWKEEEYIRKKRNKKWYWSEVKQVMNEAPEGETDPSLYNLLIVKITLSLYLSKF